MLHLFLLLLTSTANDERGHGIDLVLEQVFPVFAVNIAAFAIVVVGFRNFVRFHEIDVGEVDIAVTVATFDGLVGVK